MDRSMGQNIEHNKKQQKVTQAYLKGERPLFGEQNLYVEDTVFAEGESPLKESRNVELHGSMFQWKYPLWYSKHVTADDCTWFEMARAGVWYTDDLTVNHALIEAPKNFRRCHRLTLNHVSMPNAAETLWHCEDVTIDELMAKGDYFGMNSRNMKINDFELVGNYCFDGARNVEIHRAKLLSKDAFWNSEDVTVYDSVISGEYLGWNAKNLTLINCMIESLQGMCYVDNLVMKNCRLVNTTLAFEYSTVDVEVQGRIESILNPTSGIIRADSIGELILENDKVNVADIQIVCPEIEKYSSEVAYV